MWVIVHWWMDGWFVMLQRCIRQTHVNGFVFWTGVNKFWIWFVLKWPYAVDGTLKSRNHPPCPLGFWLSVSPPPTPQVYVGSKCKLASSSHPQVHGQTSISLCRKCACCSSCIWRIEQHLTMCVLTGGHGYGGGFHRPSRAPSHHWWQGSHRAQDHGWLQCGHPLPSQRLQ